MAMTTDLPQFLLRLCQHLVPPWKDVLFPQLPNGTPRALRVAAECNAILTTFFLDIITFHHPLVDLVSSALDLVFYTLR